MYNMNIYADFITLYEHLLFIILWTQFVISFIFGLENGSEMDYIL